MKPGQKTIREFGRSWDRKVPRGDVGYLVDRMHVTDDIEPVLRDIERRMTHPAFTPRIRRQTLQYARARHEANRATFMHVARGTYA